MKIFPRICFIVAVVLTLSACFLPDRYKANIVINQDYSYTSDFRGNVVFVPYFETPPSKRADLDKKDMIIIAGSLINKEYGITEATYIGNGRIAVTASRSGRFYKFSEIQKSPIDFIEMTHHGHSDVEVYSIEIKKNHAAQAKAMGISSVGDVCIRTSLKVVESNADSTPGMLSDCYGWTGFDALSGKRIHMVLDGARAP